MNANKFKFLLCCYAMGITGCNKIGNPSYMDGGGDRKDEKKPDFVLGSASTITVAQGSTTSYHKMLEDSLNAMKRTADLAEQIAIRDQESAERAIKAAADSKNVAETTRKNVDDREKARLELGRDSALYNEVLQDSLNAMKRTADLAEQVAIRDQESAERAIKAAADSKNVAETTRKNVDDREKARLELGGGDTL